MIDNPSTRTRAPLAVQVYGLIPEDPNPDTDAATIAAFTIRESAPPLGLTADRCDRAIARLIIASARHADEHAATVAAIARAIDALAATRRAIVANDRAQTPQETPGAPTTAPHAQGKANGGGPREPRPAQPKTNPRGPVGAYATR